MLRLSEPSNAMDHPKPYQSLIELSTNIPYSENAIRVMISRKELVEDVHYFRPERNGKKSRKMVFKWSAIVEWIESTTPSSSVNDEPARDLLPLRGVS